MTTTRLLRDPRAFWTAQAALLTPLAIFWLGVAAWMVGARDVTEALWRVMFGPTHTLVRDLFWPVILPGLAFALAGVRFIEMRGAEADAAAERAEHTQLDYSMTFGLLCALTLSFAFIGLYAVGENLLSVRG